MSVEYAQDLGLKEELDRLVGCPTAPASWSAVQERVRRKRRRRRGAGAVVAAAVVAAAGYGGWSLYSAANHDEPLLVITDAPPESLTGVKAELWSEIQRVKEQSESGALAWVDIERTWRAMGSVWSAAGYSDLDLQSWLGFWSFIEQRMLSEGSVVEMTIYLKDDARSEDVSALHAEIAAMAGVKSVVYTSKAEALERLKQTFRFRYRPEIFEDLSGNPLPASLEIELADDVSPAAIAARLAGRPEIGNISYVANYEQLLSLLRGLTPASETTTTIWSETTTTIWGEQIDLGPADQVRFKEAWRQIADLVGADVTTTWCEDYYLQFSPSGAFEAMSIALVFPGREVLVSWDGRGGPAAQKVLATVETTPIPSQDSYEALHGLHDDLSKIDEVGVAKILAELPAPGSNGYYRVGQWEPEDEMGGGSNTFAWTGAGFQPRMPSVNASSYSLVGIDGRSFDPEPSDTMRFLFVVGAFIALPNTTATTEAAPEFAPLMEAWTSRSIYVLGVGHDESEPDAVFVKISADALAPPDGVFVHASLVREAYLAVQKHGLPFDKLTISGIDADGVEVSQGAISLQSGLSLAPGRELVEEVDWTLAGSKVADAVWGSYSLGGESQFDGRVLSARLRLPEVDTRETYVGYLTGLIPALEKLNQEGYRMAVLQLSIDGPYGAPVLRDVHDFQLGLVMTWHDGEEYRPPWMD